MTTKITFVGDVVLEDTSFYTIDSKIINCIRRADLSMCNLEAPVIKKEEPIKKIGPVLHQYEDSISYLNTIGFNAFALANNHILDHGFDGLKNTLKVIKDANMKCYGAHIDSEKIYEPFVFEKNNLKVAIFSASEYHVNCGCDMHYAWLFSNKLIENIKHYREKCDYIIINCHGGLELVPLPLPEFRQKYQELCDIGVDVVIGHHPHCIQGVEHYKNSIIFYSLGDFLWKFKDNKHNYKSLMVILTLDSHKSIQYELVFCERVNNQIIVSKSNYNPIMKELSSFNSDIYIELVNQQCLRVSKEYLFDYVNRVDQKIESKMSLFHKLKTIIKYIFFKKKNIEHRMMLNDHLKNNEAYYYTLKRANTIKNQRLTNSSYNTFLLKYLKYMK